ncbi:MAG: hypothetical protein AAF528_10465 [Cyanobacteria bacterium P01_C01_bin.121]
MNLSKQRLWLSRKRSIGLSIGLSAGILTWVASISPSYASCEFFSVPQRFNTETSEDVIVIGHQSGQPYQVVVLSDDQDVLSEIRACVLDAFATRSRFGSYIQVGSFRRRGDAEVVGRILTRSGYSARVTYRR